MIEQLLLPLETTEAGKYLATFLMSMVPVIELRGGVPFGVALGLPVSGAFLTALLGNMLPVPFIVLFVRRMFAFIRARIPRLGSWVDRLEKKAWEKSDRVLKYQTWGLLLFVAIPLPGTGAWTGALIAALLDMRLKKAVPVIFLGVLIAGIIVTSLTYGVVSLLG